MVLIMSEPGLARIIGFTGLCFLLASCVSIERNNPDDPGSGSHYENGLSEVPSVSCEMKYNTVVIGSQTWMAENLNCDVPDSRCYSDDEGYCTTYGRLYNWATAMALPSSCNTNSCASKVKAKHRGICPEGWHIPSDADWNVLMKYVNPSCSDNSYCEGAGTELKSTSGWGSKGGGQDTYGFAALGSGYGTYTGYTQIESSGDWWSSSESSKTVVYSRRMSTSSDGVSRPEGWKGSSFYSVRCVRD